MTIFFFEFKTTYYFIIQHYYIIQHFCIIHIAMTLSLCRNVGYIHMAVNGTRDGCLQMIFYQIQSQEKYEK